MDNTERDSLHCVIGELYFQHKLLERKALDQISSMQKDFDNQLKIKNAQIEELINKSR